MSDLEAEPKPDFYANKGAGDSGEEAGRLKLMADIADDASIAALGAVIKIPGATILDVGAGNSHSLGDIIVGENATAVVIPLDQRESAVREHAEAGFSHAMMANVTGIPLTGASVDAAHARFVFGWGNKQEREKTLGEMIRVGNGGSRLAIVDYDWTQTDGPEPVKELIAELVGITQGLGFDPFYGAKMTSEVESFIEGFELKADEVTVTEDRTPVERTLSQAIPLIDAHVKPMIQQLQIGGLEERATGLQTLVNKIKEHALIEPNADVRLPDIVSVAIDITSPEKHEKVMRRLNVAKLAGEQMLRREIEPSLAVGPEELNTFRLVTPTAIDQARQLHARAYLLSRHVTAEGINKQDGTLIEEIDPLEIVDRSIYLGNFTPDGNVGGCIRLIEPIGDDIKTLPTVQKVFETLGDKEVALADLPFLQEGKKVYEASALGRARGTKDVLGTSRLILATVCEAQKNGYDYGVMGIVEGVAHRLVNDFGPNVFRRIDGDAAVLNVSGPGIKPEGVRLIPFYVDMHTFVKNATEYVSTNRDTLRYPDENIALFQATGSFLGPMQAQ